MNEMWQVNWTANVCEHLRGSSFPGDNVDSWTGSCPLGSKCLVEVVLTETLCSRQRMATNSCYLPFKSWSPIPWVKIGLSDFLGQFSVAEVLFWDFKFYSQEALKVCPGLIAVSGHLRNVTTPRPLRCEEAPLCHVKKTEGKDVGPVPTVPASSCWSYSNTRHCKADRVSANLCPNFKFMCKINDCYCFKLQSFGVVLYATKDNQNTLSGFLPKSKTSVC